MSVAPNDSARILAVLLGIVRAAVPRVLGIGIGSWDNRATWRADFPSDAPATAAEAATISTLFAQFDPTAPTADDARAAAFRAEPDRSDLMTRLKTATPAQIDAYVNNNITNIAAAQALFRALLKAIALDSRS